MVISVENVGMEEKIAWYLPELSKHMTQKK